MPPKRAQPSSSKLPSSAPTTNNKPTQILQSTYATITAPENQSVVRAVGLFGVAVAFLSSGWSDWLVPA